MEYIVQIPEDRARELQEAVQRINPGAPEITQVIRADNDNVVNMDAVRDYYEDAMTEDYDDLKPWRELPGAVRMELARELGNQPTWFDPDGFDDGSFTVPSDLLQNLRGPTPAR